ncbi:hypothetical protein BDZ89DRAFT_565769 [Hymenopellis radicata]|nr:hypothetical protein BDZ89DRAFT_565769 [Hymenopellis radicata]
MLTHSIRYRSNARITIAMKRKTTARMILHALSGLYNAQPSKIRTFVAPDYTSIMIPTYPSNNYPCVSKCRIPRSSKRICSRRATGDSDGRLTPAKEGELHKGCPWRYQFRRREGRCVVNGVNDGENRRTSHGDDDGGRKVGNRSNRIISAS